MAISKIKAEITLKPWAKYFLIAINLPFFLGVTEKIFVPEFLFSVEIVSGGEV